MNRDARGNRPHLLMVVQNLMGVGHQRRAAAICSAAVEAGWMATMVSGGMPMRGFDPGRTQFVQLPPARCPTLAFDRLVDEHGEEVDESWRRHRASLLGQAVADAAADVVMFETFPFGRKLLRFELVPLIERLHRHARRPLIVSSVRDIIEWRPKARKYAVMADDVERWFDLVTVHSDPRLVPLEATFPAFERIASRVRYTGFVRERAHRVPEPADTVGVDEVVVSAGGGAYGEHVLATAIEARPLSRLCDRTWRILVGDNLDAGRRAALFARAGEGIVVEPARPDFPHLLRRAAVSISQGGYNTIMDLIESRVRAVAVAYHDDTEREQLLRARLLVERGLVELVPNEELSAQRLARAVDAAATRTVPAHDFDLDGAAGTVRVVAGALAERRTER